MHVVHLEVICKFIHSSNTNVSDLESKGFKIALVLDMHRDWPTYRHTALSTHSSVFPSTLTKSTCSAIFDSCAKTVISSYQSVFMARNEAAWNSNRILIYYNSYMTTIQYLLISALAKP